MCVFSLSSTIWHTKYITLEAGRLSQRAKRLCVFIWIAWSLNRWEKCRIFKICLPKHSTCALKWSSIRAVCFTSLILKSSRSKTNSFWNSHHNEQMWVIELCVNESQSQARPHSFDSLACWWYFSGQQLFHFQALGDKFLDFFSSIILYLFGSWSCTSLYRVHCLPIVLTLGKGDKGLTYCSWIQRGLASLNEDWDDWLSFRKCFKDRVRPIMCMNKTVILRIIQEEKM